MRWRIGCCSPALARWAPNIRAAAVSSASTPSAVILAAGAAGSPHQLGVPLCAPSPQGRAALRRRRPRPPGPRRYSGPPCAARGRQDIAGSLSGARHLRRQRCEDIERDLARPAVCRRGAALSLRRQRHADLYRLAVAASVKVLEESATPDIQCLLASGSFAPGPIRRLDDKPGMTAGIWQMPAVARLCRSPLEPAR